VRRENRRFDFFGQGGFAPKKGSGALAASKPRDISTVQSSRPLFRSKAE
jgi:hypothetical protein